LKGDGGVAAAEHLDDDKNRIKFTTLPSPHMRTAEVNALYEAVIAGHNQILETLLRLCVSPDGGISRSNLGTSPLHIAAANGNTRALASLVTHGARLNACNRMHVMPVQLAAQQSSASLQHLLIAKVDPHVKDSNKQSLVHFAARAGNLDSLLILYSIQPPLELNSNDRWQRTPVHWAVLNGHIEALRSLLEHGAAPNPKTCIRILRLRTHLITETPMEIAHRVHKDNPLFEKILNMHYNIHSTP
jgi:ankyrin repeat protein